MRLEHNSPGEYDDVWATTVRALVNDLLSGGEGFDVLLGVTDPRDLASGYQSVIGSVESILDDRLLLDTHPPVDIANIVALEVL